MEDVVGCYSFTLHLDAPFHDTNLSMGRCPSSWHQEWKWMSYDCAVDDDLICGAKNTNGAACVSDENGMICGVPLLWSENGIWSEIVNGCSSAILISMTSYMSMKSWISNVLHYKIPLILAITNQRRWT